MSENCASEIGAAAGCLPTMRRTAVLVAVAQPGARSPDGRGLVGVVVMPPKGRVSKFTA